MKITTRERRDWTLLIFIIPIGIIFMMIAGQIAIRIVPQWSVNAGMQSQLDPATAPKQQVGFVQPVLPEILTPLGWLETFLTPNSDSGDDIVFPPFLVLEPTATPSPTVSPTDSPTASPTVTVTETVTVTVTVTSTPPTVTRTATRTSTAGTPSPTATTPSPTATTPSPTTTAPPITSTIDPTLVPVTPPPDLGIDTPPDGTAGNIAPGNYVVINISANPIYVGSTPDGNYDLVYYESYAYSNAGIDYILLDSVILGISQTDLSILGSIYYEIFNWGNGVPDNNTNVGPIAGAEVDNQDVPTTDLYPSPPAPAPNTGILIDVDNASSAPPAGSYGYLVIISPPNPPSQPDGAQVDAVVITEVPIPTPTP